MKYVKSNVLHQIVLMRLMIEKGVNEITLVTCEDLAATERIIVKGDLKETKDYSQTSDEILTAFNQPYKQFS